MTLYMQMYFESWKYMFLRPGAASRNLDSRPPPPLSQILDPPLVTFYDPMENTGIAIDRRFKWWSWSDRPYEMPPIRLGYRLAGMVSFCNGMENSQHSPKIPE